MHRHVSTLPISSSERAHLQKQDINYCDDLPTGSHATRHLTAPPTSTAADLWETEGMDDKVSVFHPGLDEILNGGLPLRRISLLFGRPGAGKTALCLQLCCDVQVPRDLGGVHGQALFFCTDGSFTVDRLREVASGCCKLSPERISVPSLLAGVHVVFLVTVSTLIENLQALPGFLKNNPRVRLVVLDSFSLPFLCGERDALRRTQFVHRAVTLLQNAATDCNVSVVLTVQMTTVLGVGGQTSRVMPSLGEGLRHRAALHMMLDEGEVTLLKSSHRPRMTAEFHVTKDGFR